MRQAHFSVKGTEGFTDVAVVHPATVAPAEARRFVCLASARAVRRVTLQPGAVWEGEMQVAAHDRYWDLPAWELENPAGVPVPDQSPEMLPPRRRGGAASLLDAEDL